MKTEIKGLHAILAVIAMIVFIALFKMYSVMLFLLQEKTIVSQNLDKVVSLQEQQRVHINITCTGLPRERRRIAELGQNVTDEQWLQVLQCMYERERKLVGVYALHVSKSGGTTLCDLFKKEKCFFVEGAPHANCWARRYKSHTVDFGPQWQRKQYSEELKMKDWVYFYEHETPSSACSDIRHHLHHQNQTLAMSENWLPKGGNLCQQDFSNVIVVRDPIKRMRSHYQHLFEECIRGKKGVQKEKCLQMIQGGTLNENGINYFNITFMIKWFDIISDNYYLRSINDQNIYKKPFGMEGKGNEYLKMALDNLHNFDWVMVLHAGQADEEIINTDLITRQGLGLKQKFGHSRKQKGISKNIRLDAKDVEKLKEVNKYDEVIWQEAKRLNALDVYSLKKLTQNGLDPFRGMQNISSGGESKCCGRICT